MRYVLENDELRVEIDSFGAELKSVKSKTTEQEYMWQADPKFWGRTSPVLFPFVGKLRNNSFLHGGQTYHMTQHGFARDMEFNLMKKTDTSIMFNLVTNNDTLEKFPFSFTLCIGYELKGNEVKVLWEVMNNSREKHMHFGIGAHPAFNCPIHGEDSKAGYKLYFGGVDEIRHHGNDPVTGLSIDEDLVLPLEDHRATITPEFFDRCTYIIEGKQTGEVAIEDPQGNRYLTVLFDTPLFALWSPEGKNAPFLCVEPWYGRCDSVDFEGTLKARPYDNVLEAGEKFNADYTMRFGA
ncbi:MAG: aldose 1-epimerase family protein [Lachnospiraceae bacterium]|nr:aldose 1-epimerase family protein [Lachnospiraceae bacterium]